MDVRIGIFSYRILVGIREFQAKRGDSRRDRDDWIVL